VQTILRKTCYQSKSEACTSPEKESLRRSWRLYFTPFVPISAFIREKVLIFPPPKARPSGWTFYFAEAAMPAK
jgi:hypothetical protein